MEGVTDCGCKNYQHIHKKLNKFIEIRFINNKENSK